MTNSDLVTSDELAKILKVDRATVLRKVKSGSIKPILKLPGKTGCYLFSKAVVLESESR